MELVDQGTTLDVKEVDAAVLSPRYHAGPLQLVRRREYNNYVEYIAKPTKALIFIACSMKQLGSHVLGDKSSQKMSFIYIVYNNHGVQCVFVSCCRIICNVAASTKL